VNSVQLVVTDNVEFSTCKVYEQKSQRK